MRHFNLLFIITALSLCTTATAQGTSRPVSSPPGTVTGILQDASTEAPLEYATISIYGLPDSNLITGNVSDATGTFTIALDNGQYYAKIDFISYASYFTPAFEIKAGSKAVDLGIIKMSPAAEQLVEVEVRAEKSNMQIMLDKRVFNVGQDLANMGGSAENILDNVPSVAVDVEGNVSLRGNQNVRILVDGRPSGLVGLGDNAGLRQIPANLIDRVEVITNPSSKYEAEGSVGIINIILKKDSRKGVNGSVELNGGYNGGYDRMPLYASGYPGQYGGAINLNYRKRDFNFFINTGINYRKGPGSGFQYQEFYTANGDIDFITTRDRAHFRGGYSGNVRLGADYYLTDKDIFTTSFLYRYSEDINYTEVIYTDYADVDDLMGYTMRTDDEVERDPNLEYVLSYKKDFAEKDRKLTADIRYQTNFETEGSNIREFTNPTTLPNPFLNNPTALQRANNREGERVLIAQVDYTHPFSENGRVEVGYRGSLRNISNKYLVEDQDANGEWQRINSVSNDFNFNENIQAAYANIGDKIKKFSYQLGMRYEYSYIATELLDTGEENNRSYPRPFFPSAFLSYDLPNKNAVQLSYSRRLRRPRFRELNPFFSFTDARNRYSGNPNLDPEFSHVIELNHIKYFEKGTITSAAYFRRTTGNVDRIRRIENVVENGDSLTLTITQPENLATENAYGLEFTFNAKPYDWWTLDGNFNFFRAIIDGTNLDNNFTADNLSWFMRLTSRFDIKKKTDIQLRWNYRAPNQTPQGRSKALYHLDIGVSQEILKNKGTVTLSVNDVFNSRMWRYETFGPDFYIEGDFQWRARSVTLSVNYRINQQKRRGPGGGRPGGDFGGGGDF